MGWKRWAILASATVVLAIGCAAPVPPSSYPASQTPGARGTLKQITLGTPVEPSTLPTAQGAARAIQPLLNSGLTFFDGRERHPFLAEAVPSLANGLWKLLPDGQMETTWKLREGAKWHDGIPFSADDLIFSLQVGRDKELAAFGSEVYASIGEVSAIDGQTLTVVWKQPRIDADALFDLRPLGPLPKHRLEQSYRDDKASFLDLPYWTQDYVGTGPYRVRDWTPGVGARVEANRNFVLGRPKIDEIDVLFIPDANTMTANLLAGAVDITGQVGSIDLGLQLRDQWRDGAVVFNVDSGNWIAMFPQFIDPHPAVVADLRFRRALTYAIDRQEIVDTLVGGMSPVPHSLLTPNQPAYRDIEASITKYDYDPRKAAELLQELGYRKGGDGTYRGAAGERLDIEVRSGPQEQAAKPASAIAGYWERLGVSAAAVRLSPQRVEDFEYVATHPAFAVWNRSNDVLGGLRALHSSATRLPSNNFRVPGAGNTSRYMNPEFSALLDTYFVTVPVPERTQLLGQIVRHMADQVTAVGLFYNPSPAAYSNRLQNVAARWSGALITWNAGDWDVR